MVYILSECSVLEWVGKTFDRAQMGSNQIKEVKLSSIVAPVKGLGMLSALLESM